MRIILFIIALILLISSVGKSQHWQSSVTVDSRLGYTTNSYLTPFLSEWNSTAYSGYSFTSLSGQTFWDYKDHTVSTTVGATYQPFFNQSIHNWSGLFGLSEYNYSLSGNFSVGVEGGVSSLTSSYNRNVRWIQPTFTWFVTPFTLFRGKLGSYYQAYDYPDQPLQSAWINQYNLEIETWPDYNWRVSAGINGELNTLPNIREGYNAQIKIGYLFKHGATLSLSGSFQQYQLQSTGEDFQTGGNAIQTTQNFNTDRIFRLRLQFMAPLNNQLALFGEVDQLRYISEAADIKSDDYHLSGGVRFNIEPRLGNKNKSLTPKWEVGTTKQELRVKYSGEGRLYLVGEFNDWSKNKHPLSRQSEHMHVTTLSLSPGSYEYKILRVQGNNEEWLQFSADTYTVKDGFGSENAMLLVE